MVTVTVNGPTVTEFVAGVTSSYTTHPNRVPEEEASATALQTTVTNFYTVTRVLSVVEPTTTKGTSKGPYLFHVASGSTYWLNGNTPPSTGSLVTAASTVTVQPAPTGATEAAANGGTSTSFSTLTLTTTNVLTNVLTLVSLTPSAKPFTGLAPNGWNSSSPTVHGAETTKLQVDKEIATNTTLFAAPTGSGKRLAKKQQNEWISGTINGVIVPWVNNYTPAIHKAASTSSADEASSSTTVTFELLAG